MNTSLLLVSIAYDMIVFSNGGKHKTSLKSHLCLYHMARVCPTGFGATFAVAVVLIYQLREFLLSSVINLFELRCQLKELILFYYKISPCY